MRQAPVRFPAASLREDFLDLIDPQHHWRHRFSEGGGLSEVPLRLADVLVVQPSGVEFEKREFPLAGDELRRQRFAASLNADEQDAFGRLEIELASGRRESDFRAVEPSLEPVESAKLEAIAIDGKELQHSAVLEQLSFASDDALDVFGRQTSIIDDRLRDHLPGLIERQARQRAAHPLRIVACQVDVNRLPRAYAVDDRANDFAQLFLVRKLQLNPYSERVEIR